MINCAECSKQNPEGSRFCQFCGQPLAAVPASVFGKLVARGSGLEAKEYGIPAEGLKVGRGEVCQIRITDGEISRLHAVLEAGPEGGLVVTDLSVNGTYVDGRRIKTHALEGGEQVIFGSSGAFEFEYVAPVAAPSAAAANPQGTVMGGAPGREVSVGEPGTGTVMVQTDAVQKARVQVVIDQYNVKDLFVPAGGLILGRDPARSSHAEYFNHPSVSGTHAWLRWEGTELVLFDLNSKNKTYVNGHPVSKHILQEADFIRLGEYRDRTLVFRSGKARSLTVRDISLDRPLLRIGRAPDNEIHIDHPAVSHHHAELRREGSRYVLTDQDSTNGTFVNGEMVSRHVLSLDDTISVGPVQLRFTGAAIEQQNASNEVRIDIFHLTKQVGPGPNGPKILDDISLAIPPRAFVGLLGPSGCGKTTFLDAVSGLRPATEGGVLMNRMDLNEFAQAFRSSMGYVPQEDIVHRQLTVEECITYAAGLRLPGDTTREELKDRIDEVIEQVGLEERRHMTISGLSGGQRKRVSIAIEILSKPSLLFLDEPTSGLDPHTEVQIMQLFRELANHGATLLTTTHVLGSFSLFDKVVILVRGKLAFCGEPDKLLQYFNVKSPHEIYGKLVEENTAEEWRTLFEQTPAFDAIAQELQAVAAEPPKPVSAVEATTRKKRFEGLRQWRLQTSRYLTIKMKDKMQVAFLLLQAPLIGILVSFLSDIPNAPGTLFMIMFAALWFGCANAVKEIADEQSIYRRERQTGLTIPAYLLSKVTVLGAFGAIQSLLLVAVLTAAHLHPALGGLRGNFWSAVLLTFLLSLNGTLIGLLLSSMFNTSEKALAWFPLILIPELLLAGLFVPVGSMERIIPLTNKQLAEQVAAHIEVKLPPRVADLMAESGFGRRVRGGLALGDEATAQLRKYIGGINAGMGVTLRYLSAACVSRWGLEGFSDLYIHGEHARQDYAYQLINGITISLHPEDAERMRSVLENPQSAGDDPVLGSWRRYSYMIVLAGFVLVMTLLVGLVMKRKDAPVA